MLDDFDKVSRRAADLYEILENLNRFSGLTFEARNKYIHQAVDLLESSGRSELTTFLKRHLTNQLKHEKKVLARLLKEPSDANG